MNIQHEIILELLVVAVHPGKLLFCYPIKPTLNGILIHKLFENLRNHVLINARVCTEKIALFLIKPCTHDHTQ